MTLYLFPMYNFSIELTINDVQIIVPDKYSSNKYSLTMIEFWKSKKRTKQLGTHWLWVKHFVAQLLFSVSSSREKWTACHTKMGACLDKRMSDPKSNHKETRHQTVTIERTVGLVKHLERQLKARLALDALDYPIFRLRAMLRVAGMGQKYTWNRTARPAMDKPGSVSYCGNNLQRKKASPEILETTGYHLFLLLLGSSTKYIEFSSKIKWATRV